jgi:ATP-dependent helicase HrpB
VTESVPIDAVLPELDAALAGAGAAVLVAAPGAGKSTVAPLRLLAAPWLTGRIIMLEPRRIAARAVASRLAWHLGEPVGATVGYRVRFDTKVSRQTRLEVVTEGVLTRLLADDRTLDGYGLVILDEFHERSIPADVGLALTLETRALIRPELRVLVMSATIDAASVATLLDDAPVVEAAGRVFPVETRYRPGNADIRLEARVASAVREALASDAGDVLVFLPGVGEIARVADLLATDGRDALVLPLHGTLSLEAQAAVLEPATRRRVILATSIAETSLTIPGVRVVIDAGLMRTPRFSPRTGMSRLTTVRVTRASADQRRGRAGRTAPGVCYRLWAASDDVQLLAFNPPEIAVSDLAPLVLDLAAAGVTDPSRLRWLDPPPPAALQQARELLGLLGALDAAGQLTDRGRALAGMPLHPRLGHMVLEAKRGGHGPLAAELVALLGDRDLFRRPAAAAADHVDVDLRLRLDALTGGRPLGVEVDRSRLHRLRGEIQEWRRRLGVTGPARPEVDEAGRLLAWAYPDRVAQRRPGPPGRFLLRNGRGAFLAPNQPLARADYLVAAQLDDAGAESRIQLAAPLDAESVAALVAEEGEVVQRVEFDRTRRAVRAVELTMLGALVIAERPVRSPDPALTRSTLLAAIRREGLAVFHWTDEAVRLRARLAFLHGLDASWPDVSEEGLLGSVEVWVGSAIEGRLSLDGLDPGALLLAWLSWEQRSSLDRLAPDRVQVPTGSRLTVDYSDPAAPVLAVRLQEMFGQAMTPSIGDGRVPLTIHLLSPAGRPLQVTRDLAGFWRTSYFDVRREMRGRYPRHEWPEDPMAAPPTRRAKRRN